LSSLAMSAQKLLPEWKPENLTKTVNKVGVNPQLQDVNTTLGSPKTNFGMNAAKLSPLDNVVSQPLQQTTRESLSPFEKFATSLTKAPYTADEMSKLEDTSKGLLTGNVIAKKELAPGYKAVAPDGIKEKTIKRVVDGKTITEKHVWDPDINDYVKSVSESVGKGISVGTVVNEAFNDIVAGKITLEQAKLMIGKTTELDNNAKRDAIAKVISKYNSRKSKKTTTKKTGYVPTGGF
jgi:hypothetical protein